MDSLTQAKIAHLEMCIKINRDCERRATEENRLTLAEIVGRYARELEGELSAILEGCNKQETPDESGVPTV